MKRAIVEYDYIRAVAVLLVVLGHCTYYKIVTLNGGIDYGINSEQSMVGKINPKSNYINTLCLSHASFYSFEWKFVGGNYSR